MKLGLSKILSIDNDIDSGMSRDEVVDKHNISLSVYYKIKGRKSNYEFLNNGLETLSKKELIDEIRLLRNKIKTMEKEIKEITNKI